MSHLWKNTRAQQFAGKLIQADMCNRETTYPSMFLICHFLPSEEVEAIVVIRWRFAYEARKRLKNPYDLFEETRFFRGFWLKSLPWISRLILPEHLLFFYIFLHSHFLLHRNNTEFDVVDPKCIGCFYVIEKIQNSRMLIQNLSIVLTPLARTEIKVVDPKFINCFYTIETIQKFRLSILNLTTLLERRERSKIQNFLIVFTP